MPTEAQFVVEMIGSSNVNLYASFDFGQRPALGKWIAVGQAAACHSQANGWCGMDYCG